MEIARSDADLKYPPLTRSPRGRLATGEPNPVDVHVGARVRMRRMWLGITQEKLGEAIGLTFQQVQKYERGANRIGASRLWDIAQVLGCPMSFFFEEMEEDTAKSSPRNLDGATSDLHANGDLGKERQALELMRAFYRIPDYSVRNRICDLAKSLAVPSGDGSAPDHH